MALYILFGPPGAGKGSMAELLKERQGMAHISTGDALRDEKAKGTPLGKTAEAIMEQGKLVPDEVVAAIVTNKLAGCCNQGNDILLDGFPRTLGQAQLLDQLLSEKQLAITAVLSLEVNEPLLIARLTQRRTCRDCGAVYNLRFHPPQQAGVCDKCAGKLYQRDDDSDATVRNRLQVYAEQTQPLAEYYEQRQLLRHVDASGNLEDNYQACGDAMPQQAS